MLPFESLLLMFGCCCAGPTFLISGSDLCDSFPLAQGLAHLGLAPSVVGLCSFEMLLSLQRSACSGFPLPSPGFSWSGSLVSAPGMGHLGAGFLPQAFTCLAVSISAWDFGHYDSLVPLQSPGRPELPSLAFGLRFEPALPVSDPLHLDSSTFLQSCARLDVFLPALCWSHFEPTLLLRSPTWLDLTLFLTGSGGLQQLSVQDWAHLEPSMAIQSFSCVDAVVSAIALVNFGMLLLIRGKCWLDFLLLPAGFGSTGPLPFAAELTAIPLGFLLMIQSLVCLGLLVPALDATTSGPATFSQNMARLGALMAVVDFTSLGLFVSMRALSCFGSPFPALGLTWLGFVFVLLVVSLASLEVPMPVQALS